MLQFWRSSSIWQRAAVNTSRCLVGCSVGDLGSLFVMQSAVAPLPASVQVPISVVCGLGTSLVLETVYLKRTEPGIETWMQAGKVAWGMSFISMSAMELAMTLTEQHLTSGVFQPSDPTWWASVGVALGAGFLVPLPYSYYQLKLHNRSCCGGKKKQ